MKYLTVLIAVLIISAQPSPGICADEHACSDPAKAIEVPACGEFSITLESNKTTGFGWDISKPLDEKTVVFLSSEYVASGSALAGAPGREIWTFRACSPGKTSISFKYVRPWEKDVPADKNVDFTVVVK